MTLAGKVAVVTGAAQGVGAACAERFTAQGAAVVCVDIKEDAVTELAERLRQAGHRAHALAADVSTADGNDEMVRCAVDMFGGLDVLHANAAIVEMGRVEDTQPEAWDRLHATNLRGVFLGVQAALPALRSRGGGSIVITASALGLVGDPDMPAYGAMKGGLRALCRSLAVAHGPENIRINTICPGDIETPLLKQFFDFQPDPGAARSEITAHYPLGRFASPQDVAAVAAFLASDDASYLSGIDIVVDGGLLARIY
jgi:NAD(P)-dependent dehydrogenase (short-subunit alcohol dehydrogenase family)